MSAVAVLAQRHLARPTIDKVKQALRISAGEGMAYGGFVGVGDHYVMAFAVAMQTSSLQLGVLAALPGFLASSAQLWDQSLVRLLRSRKAVVLVFAAAQGLIFVPMLLLALLAWGSPGWWLIFFASLYSTFGALVSPAWGSIMAEIVPQNLRGSYFSLRGRLSTLATVVTFLLAGVFLNLLVHRALWGFAVLFGAAIGLRFLSWLFLTRLYELPAAKTEQQGSASEFVRGLGSTNLGRYLLFLFAMSFVVNIASPYFTVYELRDLHFSYLTFAVLETGSSLAMLFAITHWGHAADKAGNYRILAISAYLIPAVPLLWLASSNLAYLGAVQLFSGMAWAGFNLCTVNYLFDATSSEDRTKYLAYFNAGNGIATGAGALLGGSLAPHLPAFLGYQILTLFLISGVLRLLVTVVFLPRIHEVRRVSKLPASQLFHILMGGRPVNRRLSHRRHAHLHHVRPTAPPVSTV